MIQDTQLATNQHYSLTLTLAFLTSLVLTINRYWFLGEDNGELKVNGEFSSNFSFLKEIATAPRLSSMPKKF